MKPAIYEAFGTPGKHIDRPHLAESGHCMGRRLDGFMGGMEGQPSTEADVHCWRRSLMKSRLLILEWWIEISLDNPSRR